MAKISLRNPKNKKRYGAVLEIIDEDYTPLLGSAAAQKIGVITVKEENIIIMQINERHVQDAYHELPMERITSLERFSIECRKY